ncbi:uncharacterized protein LOC127860321 [Dreissena polymorpha]|uniref:Uncharacterized protein n=1 Tax=Dreissena polymorpha TaxID=45954 RepID=A0A9D3YRK8_DREPO|nr:uncharacterized protein LOC127860321 [Dreissena polymorpha]KAH3704826.1 hypothetical protein DPMN_079887 [Dreissena polymorpha]
MPDKKQIVSYVAIGLSGLNVLFCILALALNSWLDNGHSSFGLWEVCTGNACVSWDIVAGWMDAVRAFAFLGLFAMVGATVTAVLYEFIIKGNNILLYLTLGLAAGAGFFMMIAFSVFADHSSGSYGAAFALCIIAWLIGWAVAGLCVLIMFLNRTT